MQRLPTKIFDVASVREMDRVAIQDLGIPGYTLMTRAGEAALNVAREAFPVARRWQVVCGAGNNGGDGYVIARLAARDGIDVSVLSLVDPDALAGDAAIACKDFVAEGGQVLRWDGGIDDQTELIIDALLGNGIERNVAGRFAAAVAAINAHMAPVHALDIASGINGDSGQIMGCAVRANITTTFVALKSGLFLDQGPGHCGELSFAGLDIPADGVAHIGPVYRRIGECCLSDALPVRARTAHKGDFGHVLVVGGGEGMPGAVRLCGEAALRAGAGKVSLATHPTHAALVAAGRPELMSHGVASGSDLRDLLDQADVVALGPGLGQSDWARELFALVADSSKPAVWDADALNLLAETPACAANRVITPHPGEAARLLGVDAAAVQADRVAALQDLQARFAGTAVLKGAGSLISSSDSVPYICCWGNPGMAAAGMGDALAGIIAALLAQGLDCELAAVAGVAVHARAGDLAAQKGERGMITSDLIDALRQVVNP